MEELNQTLEVDYVGLSISHIDALTKIYRNLTDRMATIGINKDKDDPNEESLLLQRLKKNILDVTNIMVESIIEETYEDDPGNLTEEDIKNAFIINPKLKLSNEDSSVVLSLVDGKLYDQKNNLFDLNKLRNTKWKIQNN